MRREIMSAMRRMLSGSPLRVPAGALTVRHLAVEAEVGRHHLYQSCDDLRERFQLLSEGHQGDDVDAAREKAERAGAELARVRALHKRTSQEKRMWKDTCEVLQRAINVLQEELRQEQLKSARLARKLAEGAGSGGPVVPIRPR